MIDVDFTQLPFSLLDEEHRHRLENAMEMAYFEAGTVIIEARHPAQFVYPVSYTHLTLPTNREV